MSTGAPDSGTPNTRPKRALVVAYHFPPQMGSSGLLRTLKYCRYLPEHGWEPTVLTAHPWAYERVGDSQMQEIPSQVKVVRAFALDTRKHLSLRGRYLRFTALPDRWITWSLAAVPAGLIEIYKGDIDVIFTTYPIATAVLIGYLLHKITGLPWVADFRDPMTEEDYPRDPRTRRMLRWLEKKAVLHASRLVFTARSTMQRYLERFPELSPDKCLVISNGYDEADFRSLQPVSSKEQRTSIRMQHSGLIYPEERNPLPFFKALSRLKQEGKISGSWFSVDLRACGDAERFQQSVAQLSIQDVVHFPPALPYRESLQDSQQSDILLLLQGASCDHQIPAKTYEYLRLGRPILALTTNTGDTAAVLKECGGATIVDIADEEAIYRTLPQILEAVRAGVHPLPEFDKVARYSRESQAQELAQCLSQSIESANGSPAASAIKRSAAGS
jgi:glycosyltransferase involved in cell wall biosynthesis